MSELDPAADPVDPQNPNPAPNDPLADPPAGDPPSGDLAPKDPPAGDPDPKDPPKDDDPDAGKADWPEDWRERMAGGDEDAIKLLKRYGSIKGVAKALVEKDKLIRSGKIKRDMPDASDEKAMAEWRKEQGVPDDPTGYILPETVTKRMTDDDKPLLASFTEYAHGKGAPQAVIDIGAEWYFDTLETMEEQRIASDREASEACEETLRKDWAHGEFKPNLTLGKRYMEGVPGVGASWTEARLPDGRRLGDIPEFVMWAADQGREHYGDATFANSDSEKRHTARKDEIEKLMKEDINKYYETGADKEYADILEKEQKRAKR